MTSYSLVSSKSRITAVMGARKVAARTDAGRGPVSEWLEE